MNKELEEFRRKVLKIDGPRVHKITNSVGLKEAYQWCKKNKLEGIGTKDMTECMFYKVISTVHKKAIEELYQGHSFKLPGRMGKFEVRVVKKYLYMKDGKVVTNRRIDWPATLALWCEDEEAREEKILVRRNDNINVYVFYDRSRAEYTNKHFVKFRPTRTILKHLTELVKNKEISAYEMNIN